MAELVEQLQCSKIVLKDMSCQRRKLRVIVETSNVMAMRRERVAPQMEGEMKDEIMVVVIFSKYLSCFSEDRGLQEGIKMRAVEG